MQDTLKSINPATLEIVGEVKVTTESELTDIVTNAQQAFKSWRQVPLKKRVKKITAAFESLEPLHRGLAQLMNQEMGKDVRRSMGEVSGVIYGAAYSADDVAAALKPNNVGGDTVMQYLPLGICAVISPWNYPLAMAVNLIEVLVTCACISK